MNKPQTNRWQAVLRGKDFNTKYSFELSNIAEYGPLMATYNQLIAGVKDALGNQTVDVKAATPTKKRLKVEMGQCVVKFAERGMVKANMMKEFVLEESLKISLSYIIRARDTEAASRASVVKELMKKNLNILDNLSLGDISEMEARIEAFKSIKGTPVKMKKIKKAKGTNLIPGLLNKLDVVKGYMTKLIHSYLPELTPTWDQYIKVGKPLGRRKLSLVVSYRDSMVDAPLRRIKVTLSNGVRTIEKWSTKKGFTRFHSLESGNWTLTAERKNYLIEVRTDIKIVHGEISKLDILMKKVWGDVVNPDTPDITCAGQVRVRDRCVYGTG